MDNEYRKSNLYKSGPPLHHFGYPRSQRVLQTVLQPEADPARWFQRKFYGALKRLGYAIQVWEIRKATNKWADYLETIEGQYHDENEQLIESMLGEEGVHPAQFPGSSMGAGLENAVIVGD